MISKVTFTEWLPDQPGVVGALAEKECRFPGVAVTDNSVNGPPVCGPDGATASVFAENLYRLPGTALGDNWVTLLTEEPETNSNKDIHPTRTNR